MLIGVARTSTSDQIAGLEAQIRDLRAVGCERIFSEHVSATARVRPKLIEALEFVREGDTLVVCKPDRLARSVADLLSIEAKLRAKGVALRILSMGGQELDTRNPTSRLMLTVLTAVAEFEIQLQKDRQIEGIAASRAAGKYRGRAPTARAKSAEVLALKQAGHGPVAIAAQIGISRASVQRILAAAEKKAA